MELTNDLAHMYFNALCSHKQWTSLIGASTSTCLHNIVSRAYFRVIQDQTSSPQHRQRAPHQQPPCPHSLTSFKSVLQCFCFFFLILMGNPKWQNALLIVKVPKETGLCDQRFRLPVYLPCPNESTSLRQALWLSNFREILRFLPIDKRLQKAYTPSLFLLTISALIKQTPKCWALGWILWKRVKNEVIAVSVRLDVTVGGWCLEDMKIIQLK